ncbi:MAG: PEP-CTERM sorting domain-containing protein [Sedimentisphaerales bacterium]
MRHTKATLWMVALAAFVLAGTSFATVIQDIGGTLNQTDWYYGSGQYFKPNSTGGTSNAQINLLGFTSQGQTDPDYYMFYGDFAMGQSKLLQDKSSGGLANGIFASGATLTINGDLYANDFSTVVATGDLIKAEVTAQWELRELPPQSQANTVIGRAFFHITGGALSNSSLNDAGLSIGDFYIDFTFSGCTPNVTDFSSALGSSIYNCSDPTIQFGFVPEPASVALLGLGGLALLRRRR